MLVHMIGPRVADMIAEAVVAMEFASAEDMLIVMLIQRNRSFQEAFN